MNLLNFSNNITTYSDSALIGLADVVHLTCPSFEVVTFPSQGEYPGLYRLMYIHKGSILVQGEHSDKKTAPLPFGSVLLNSCNDELRFRATEGDLDAWVFYIHGNALPYYKEVTGSAALPFVIQRTNDVTNSIHSLIQLKQSKSLAEEIWVNNLLTALFAEWTEAFSLSDVLPPAVPTYLSAVKEDFDKNYGSDFSLDELALKYKVNKYRLCRDFAKYYELSPIKYLNKIRIQNACLLLVSTDMHVGEIAAAVGIENANHFIRLFKTQMGATPLEYRQKLL